MRVGSRTHIPMVAIRSDSMLDYSNMCVMCTDDDGDDVLCSKRVIDIYQRIIEFRFRICSFRLMEYIATVLT